MRTCTIDGCDKAHRAKGLCVTHYNQQDPNRHKPIETECGQCREPITRNSRAARWDNNYCSELCTHWGKFGTPWSTKLPAEHWARMYGATCEWIEPNRVACEWCGTVVLGLQRRAKFCTKDCKKKSGRRKRRAAEHGAVGTYTWSELTRLWIKFDRRCAYCYTPTPLDKIQAEHVHPLSRGGRNDLSNLLPSCGPCNSDKRALLLDEWNPDRLRRHLEPVTTTWVDDDPRYSHLVEAISIRAAA